MRFDDRLLTVLNQPAEDRHDVAVRWRQLVDLVARAGAGNGSQSIAAALRAINQEASRVDESLRAAAARAVAALPLPFALMEFFASDTLAVAAPILAAATLNEDEWRALHAVANEETRAFIETLHPRAANGSGASTTLASDDDATPAERAPYIPPSVHEVVERIEQRRLLRASQGAAEASESPSVAETISLFRWECSPSGEIAWVEGAPRGALIGRSIAKTLEAGGDRIDQDVLRAFGLRAPFRDGRLTLANGGSASGDWKISGVPAFDPVDGRFAGYRGVALRETEVTDLSPDPCNDVMPEILADPASLRELVHEIKTPLNAIIGFAEIIEGQYLGPADRSYRNRAAEIVRQARLLLTAIDDLDFAAKLHSAAAPRRERVDLTALLDRQAQQLQELASRKGCSVDVISSRFDVPASVEPELADRLLFRLVDAATDLAQAGDRLEVAADLSSRSARAVVGGAHSLRDLPDAEVFGSSSRGVRGGFMLRLTRGLAQLAGGDLTNTRDGIALVFPRA